MSRNNRDMLHKLKTPELNSDFKQFFQFVHPGLHKVLGVQHFYLPASYVYYAILNVFFQLVHPGLQVTTG